MIDQKPSFFFHARLVKHVMAAHQNESEHIYDSMYLCEISIAAVAEKVSLCQKCNQSFPMSVFNSKLSRIAGMSDREHPVKTLTTTHHDGVHTAQLALLPRTLTTTPLLADETKEVPPSM